jgi:hypothetical protein
LPKVPKLKNLYSLPLIPQGGTDCTDLIRSYLINRESNEINTFQTGAEARISVEAAIYAGSKEPAPRTEVRGFHPLPTQNHL